MFDDYDFMMGLTNYAVVPFIVGFGIIMLIGYLVRKK